jgi:hypothetical protein
LYREEEEDNCDVTVFIVLLWFRLADDFCWLFVS